MRDDGIEMMADDDVGRQIYQRAIEKAAQEITRSMDEDIIDKILLENEHEQYYKKMGL